MDPPPLACTVRGCGLALERTDAAWACPKGHAYDVARRGYVNLLQPQDRRSRQAGDSKAAVEARAALVDAGVGRAVIDEVAGRMASLAVPNRPVVVDLGSGTGDALAAMARQRPITAIGIDLSVAAAEHAARRFHDATWVVANADKRLPLLDHRVDVVLSLHGRRNPVECARVLAAGGLLMVAIPAADDLAELRARVQGAAVVRDRSEPLVAEHEAHFALVARSTVRERAVLDPAALLALLGATYRGRRRATAGRVESLERMAVTLASDVLLLTPR